MITFLRGRLVHALPTQATIDVGGVGYEVLIALSSYDKLPTAGQPIEVLTHLHVREDAQNALVKARNDYADAQARYRVAIAALQVYTGSF